jgi:hypothetical protein
VHENPEAAPARSEAGEACVEDGNIIGGLGHREELALSRWRQLHVVSRRYDAQRRLSRQRLCFGALSLPRFVPCPIRGDRLRVGVFRDQILTANTASLFT